MVTNVALENALAFLVKCVDSGEWYRIDLAMEVAKEALGYDPTKMACGKHEAN